MFKHLLPRIGNHGLSIPSVCNICAKAESFIVVRRTYARWQSVTEATILKQMRGDALHPHIEATYIFVIAEPLYEIMGTVLNVGDIHRVDELQPICLPSSTRFWAGTILAPSPLRRSEFFIRKPRFEQSRCAPDARYLGGIAKTKGSTSFMINSADD